MRLRLLLPLATLTLLSGCGGSTVSSLNEISDILSGISTGNSIIDSVASDNNAAERSAIQGIDAATGSADAMLAAAVDSGPALTEETFNPSELEIGEVVLVEGSDGGSDLAIVKLAGSSFGGEETFLTTNDEESRIVKYSEGFQLFQENRNEVEERQDTIEDFTELSSEEVGANVSFIIFEDFLYDSTNTVLLSNTLEIEVYDATGQPAVSVSRTKVETQGSSNKFLHGDYLTESLAENGGSFELPNGVQTYTGTVLLGNGGDAVVFGTNLEMSVDFNTSTGTLSASDLVSPPTGGFQGDTGSLAGEFTVINSTGSFTGSGVVTLNNTSEIGGIIGSFDSTANLAGGLVESSEITGFFAAQKD